MKIAFRHDGNIVVIGIGKTTNKKIALPSEKVVQTYTFSEDQFNLARSDKKFTMREFFAQDTSNCLDCPFSGNAHASGNGAMDSKGKPVRCYTHKVMQYSGFLSMLRSISVVHDLTSEIRLAIVNMAKGNYVRFGTYGEPSLIPADLISAMVSVAKSYTGYTHQWRKDLKQDYSMFFMASVHDQSEATIASENGWRSFIAKSASDSADGIQCPASAESGYVSHCSKCGLCSGTLGKGSKNVKINIH